MAGLRGLPLLCIVSLLAICVLPAASIRKTRAQQHTDKEEQPWLPSLNFRNWGRPVAASSRPEWHTAQRLHQPRGGIDMTNMTLPPWVVSTIERPERLYGYDVEGNVTSLEWLTSGELATYDLWSGIQGGTVAVASSRVGVVAALAAMFLETPTVNFNPDAAVQGLKATSATITSPQGVQTAEKIGDDAEQVFTALKVKDSCQGDFQPCMNYVMALNGLLLGYAKEDAQAEGIPTSFVIRDVYNTPAEFQEAITQASAVVADKVVFDFLKADYVEGR